MSVVNFCVFDEKVVAGALFTGNVRVALVFPILFIVDPVVPTLAGFLRVLESVLVVVAVVVVEVLA